MIFNVTYWLFGFLRMGTGGLTAQAYGRNDKHEASTTGLRSLLISLLLGSAIIVLQVPLYSTALWIITPDSGIIDLIWTYIKICVWGAPASLGLFALNGWFIGMQNTRIPMLISITQNIVNIIVSLLFVYGFGMKLNGVAAGTLTAQWSGFLIGLVFFIKRCPYLSVTGIGEISALKRFFTVNRDIFLRTIFLVTVNLYFVAAGAKGGTLILAVNTLLMQLFTLYSFVMDGFAYAAEALCGRYYGARDDASLHATIHGVFLWSIALTTLYTLTYYIFGEQILCILTDEPAVIKTSMDYLPWAWAIPAAGIIAFVWDGVFIGMTMTRGMLAGTCSAAIVFFTVYFSLYPTLSNHALWLAFILYLLTRGITQTIWWKRVK